MDKIPEPIRTDKEDRYTQKEQASSWHQRMVTQFSSLRHRNLIIGIAALIILLLLSLLFFRSPKPITDTPAQWHEVPSANDSKPAPAELSTTELEPAPIAREATQSNLPTKANKEITISGEMIDNLEQKILSLEPKTPPKAPVINSVQGEQTLTTKLPANHFTIQISASSSKANLQAYAKKYRLSNYQIYQSKHAAISPWYVLIKGDFASKHAAKAAINALPKAVQSNSPWIKSGKTVQKEKR